MALIGKIREKSGWAIGIVAAGLGLFIVGGDILSPTSVIRGQSSQVAGEMAGEEIPVARFQQEIDEMKYAYYLNTNKTPEEEQLQQFSGQAWNQLLFKIAYQKEFDKLGLVVGKEEAIDMVQGKNIHPAIYQSFRDPQTGQFDRGRVIYYLQNISKMEQKAQVQWYYFEKNLAPDRLRTKYEALIKKTVYITQAEAKREYLVQSQKADIKFLYVPFTSVPDNEVPITDDDIDSYIDKNEVRFPKDPSANLEYIAYAIIPSKADSVNFTNELEEIKSEFQATEDDSSYVALNADNPTPPSWVNPGELPTSLQALSSFEKNMVYGPYTEGGIAKLYKIGDIKNDSLYAAKASHILFRWDSDTPENKKKALDKAKEVLAKIKKGEKFETLAAEFGTDGTASRGGDLGWFGEGRMVKPFQEAVFKASSKGLLPEPVETQFGYHIIKVTETKTNKKFYLASIDKAITAGDDTRDSVYKKAETIALNSQDLDQFTANVAQVPGLSKISAPFVTPSSLYINNLNNPKEIVRWAFNEAKEGNVSPVFEVDNQFIVAAITQKYDEGKVNIAVNKQQVAFIVYNDKKAEKIIEKIGGENNNIDDAAKKVGNSAIVNSATDVNLASASLTSIGYEPEAVGRVFGLKDGQTSTPLKGNSGVLMVQAVKLYAAGDIADYNQYKTQLYNSSNSRTEYSIAEAIKDKSKVKDIRYKFF